VVTREENPRLERSIDEDSDRVDLAVRGHDHRLAKARKMTFGIGLLKGMAVTLKHLFKHNTVIQYPDEKQDLSPRTRGVIALKEENCTVCMLCARECPDWCIYIDSHKEELPPKREGGRKRKRNVLDRFAIDYALCMYCGICVEVCPYDALFWSREFEYAEYDIRELTHEKERLSDWMASVLPPPALEEGAGEEAAEKKPASVTSPAAETTTPATGARPATKSSSAAAERPQQAVSAPEEGTAAPEAARPKETEPGVSPERSESSAAAAGEPGTTPPTEEREGRAAPDLSREAAAEQRRPQAGTVSVPQVQVPHEQARPVPLEPAEDPEEVYRRVLEEQREIGSSPQVAEARAKVARVKAARGIRPQTPTPIETDKKVPSAPTRSERTGEDRGEMPSGAPEAEGPQPEPGPVAPEGEDG
jgi:NADH-quinone oxidoreductase subunit I